MKIQQNFEITNPYSLLPPIKEYEKYSLQSNKSKRSLADTKAKKQMQKKARKINR